MVFQKKLPGPAPRPRRSAQQLAQELGLDISFVMDALQSVGEYVDSSRKRAIEEPAVKKVYEHFDRTYTPEPTKPVPDWQRRDLGRPAPRAARQAPQNPRRSVDGPRTLETPDTSLGIGDSRSDAADAWAYEEWKYYKFSPAEHDAWIDAGLRRGQAREAATLREAGLTAADLTKDVYGWSVAKRLRSGENAQEVARQLRRAQHGQETG